MHDDLADLGIPFALHKAPSDIVSGLEENSTCTLCNRQCRYVFTLIQNDYVVDPCGKCGSPVALRIGWPDEKPEPSSCERCGAICNWPEGRARDQIATCYECLRGGRAGIGHETELGLVDLGHALRGLTYSARTTIADREALETIVLKTYDDGSQSMGVLLPRDLLIELTRTPRHIVLQREYWPYHCKGFMAYLGRWRQEDFDKQSPGHGRAWFGEHMPPEDPWEDMWEWLEGDIGWSYVYQCQSCGLHRVFVDSD